MTKADKEVKMKKIKFKRLLRSFGCGFLIFTLCLSNATGVLASASKIEKEKKEAEKKLKDVEQSIGSIEQNKNTANNQVKVMNSDLSDLLAIIQILESDIANKKLDIEQAQIDYEAAKKQEESQYDAMKKRIKYIYEAGETDYLDILLQSKNISELLNKSEYVKELHNYDKKMLDGYRETKLEVADLKEELEEDKSEMEVMEKEYLGQKDDLQTMITKKKKEVSNFDEQLVQAKKTADAYAKSVEEQTVKLKKAREEEQKKKAQEAARKKAEAAAANSKPNKTNNSASKPGPGTTTKSSGGTASGRAIADYGLQFVGNPYVYGGTSLTNGADCSGFTQSIYRNFGISLPRTSSEQASWGRAVDYSDIQPGDLVCYAGHVGISIGGGQIVHASSARTGIKVSPAAYRTILAVRRQ